MRRSLGGMAFLILQAACGFSFPSVNQVIDQRILGVATAPAQISVGAPAAVEWSALVVDPRTTNPISFQVRVCLVPAGSDGLSLGSGSRSGRGGIAAGLSLSTGNQESLANVSSVNECPAGSPVLVSDTQPQGTLNEQFLLPPDVVAALMAPPMHDFDAGDEDGGESDAGQFDAGPTDAGQVDAGPPDAGPTINLDASLPELASGAVYLQFELDTVTDGGNQVAVKDVPITPALPPGDVANQNPIMQEISIDGAPWPDGGTITIPFAACAQPMQTGLFNTRGNVATCVHTLVPVFLSTESEQYHLPDPDGGWDVHRERLTFSWFTNQGTFNHGSTGQASAGEISDGGDLESGWAEPETSDGGATIWVVIRDGRGGESWLTRQVVFQQ